MKSSLKRELKRFPFFCEKMSKNILILYVLSAIFDVSKFAEERKNGGY